MGEVQFLCWSETYCSCVLEWQRFTVLSYGNYNAIVIILLVFSRVIYTFHLFCLIFVNMMKIEKRKKKEDRDCQVDKVPAQGFKDWTLSWPIEPFEEAIENHGICLEDDMKVMWVNKSKQTCWHCATCDAVLVSDTHSPRDKRRLHLNSTSGQEIPWSSKFPSSHCLKEIEPFVDCSTVVPVHFHYQFCQKITT